MRFSANACAAGDASKWHGYAVVPAYDAAGGAGGGLRDVPTANIDDLRRLTVLYPARFGIFSFILFFRFSAVFSSCGHQMLTIHRLNQLGQRDYRSKCKRKPANVDVALPCWPVRKGSRRKGTIGTRANLELSADAFSTLASERCQKVAVRRGREERAGGLFWTATSVVGTHMSHRFRAGAPPLRAYYRVFEQSNRERNRDRTNYWIELMKLEENGTRIFEGTVLLRNREDERARTVLEQKIRRRTDKKFELLSPLS